MSENTKHSPAPWAEDAGIILCSKKNEKGLRYAVAVTNTPFEPTAGFVNLDEDRANRRLIVAAPDMLEALEADEAAYQHAFSCEKCSAGRFGVFCEEGAEMKHKAQRMRLAAIAKARGQ